MFKIIKSSFSLDYRTLAFYRMFLGIVVMLDALFRMPDILNFYTDMGVVPRDVFVKTMAQPWSFSLHLASGSTAFIAAMLFLHVLFGLMLSLGYKTTWATIGAYLLTTSLHNRNWIVNNGGDDLIRALLFISIFLPLNRLFSLDSALTEKKTPLKKEHTSTWALAVYVQVFVVYFMSYLLKTSPIWRSEFTALAYSLHLDIFATPITLLIRDIFPLTQVFTMLTIWLEWGGPLLLVYSFLAGRQWWILRLIVVGLFISLHLGIFLTMKIGLFPLTCITMWILMIPGPAWDKLAEYFRKKSFHKLSLYYDAECFFCKKSVLILREFFLLGDVGVYPAQNYPEIYASMLKENSWVIVNEKGERFTHTQAMVELMRHSPVLFPFSQFFARPLPLKTGNLIYKWVSTHRQTMSHFSQTFEFRSVKKQFQWLRWPYQIVGFIICVSLLMWNLITVKRWGLQSPIAQNIIRHVHLYQEWNMFSPFPKTDNIWIEVPGTLTSGEQLDLITGLPLTDEHKDQSFYRAVPGEHWRKFFLNLSGNTTNTRLYGGFLCRRWNEVGIKLKENTVLRKLDIHVMSQPNHPDGTRDPAKRALTWHHYCFDEDFKQLTSPSSSSPRNPR